MKKFQFTGMKALSFQSFVGASGAIEAVPEQRMPDGGEVDTDLMCPAGLKNAADMRISVIAIQYGPAGQSRARIFICDSHFRRLFGFLPMGLLMVPESSLNLPQAIASYSLERDLSESWDERN